MKMVSMKSKTVAARAVMSADVVGYTRPQAAQHFNDF